MGLSLTIEIDERVLPALDAAAARRSTSREAVLTQALGDYLGLMPDGASSELGIAPEADGAGRPVVCRPDPYLVYLDEFLSEWHSPEDADAFDHL